MLCCISQLCAGPTHFRHRQHNAGKNNNNNDTSIFFFKKTGDLSCSSYILHSKILTYIKLKKA